MDYSLQSAVNNSLNFQSAPCWYRHTPQGDPRNDPTSLPPDARGDPRQDLPRPSEIPSASGHHRSDLSDPNSHFLGATVGGSFSTPFPVGPPIPNQMLTSPILTASILGSASQNPVLLKAYYQTIGATPVPRRPRSEKKPFPDEQKNEKYFERRARNNGAAKKSRDLRKQREDELAIRASMLEKENAMLKAQIMTYREEMLHLQQMLMHRRS